MIDTAINVMFLITMGALVVLTLSLVTLIVSGDTGMTTRHPIAERCADLKITQSDLARAIGVPRQHITKWDRRMWTPGPDLMAKLATELGTDSDTMYAELGSIPPDVTQAIEDGAPASYQRVRDALRGEE